MNTFPVKSSNDENKEKDAWNGTSKKHWMPAECARGRACGWVIAG